MTLGPSLGTMSMIPPERPPVGPEAGSLTMSLDDPCAVCRFDGAHYSMADHVGTLRSLEPRWFATIEGVDPALLDSRVHDEANPDGGPTLAELGRYVQGCFDAGDAHGGGHALHLAGRLRHSLGAGASRQVGRVVGVFASDGGVPKVAVGEAVVGYRGLEGDRQASRKHHGRVWQAICLWSADVIEALRAEGHPIAPGCAGENVTVADLDWPSLRPGVQLRLGSVLAEVSAYTAPCAANAAWFVDRDFHRMAHDRHPGWSRAYASVMEDGVVRVGDEAVVEPHG